MYEQLKIIIRDLGIIFNSTLRYRSYRYKSFGVVIGVIVLCILSIKSPLYIVKYSPLNFNSINFIPSPVSTNDIDIIIQNYVKSYKIHSTSALKKILLKQDLSIKNRNQIIKAISHHLQFNNTKKTQTISLLYSFDGIKSSLYAIKMIIIKNKKRENIQISKNSSGNFFSSDQIIALPKEDILKTFSIKRSLFSATNKNHIPKKIAIELLDIFKSDVSFSSDINPHNTNYISVMYDDFLNDGKIVEIGNVLYAKITIANKSYTYYKYKIANHEVYLNSKGKSANPFLLKKPIKHGRISSYFGIRKHPIFKRTKMHTGIDYASAEGTKIFAGGNGTVIKRRYSRGYGNYIDIKHNSGFVTRYGHMSKFSSNIKVGSKVIQGQLIGYVGHTGYATGPHVHYEVRYRGKPVNPKHNYSLSGIRLFGKKLSQFKKFVYSIQQKIKKHLVSGERYTEKNLQ